jgi:hypothetical protein
MIDDERAEELEERDRIGEKAPAADAAFGGRSLITEPKGNSHIPPPVVARQVAAYEEATLHTGPPEDPYSVDVEKMSLRDRLRWITGR